MGGRDKKDQELKSCLVINILLKAIKMLGKKKKKKAEDGEEKRSVGELKNGVISVLTWKDLVYDFINLFPKF